jgi:hypothetical protein
LIALFTGKAKVALRKCRRVLLRDLEPIWIRSPDAKYWIYSLKEPTHITLKCRPLGGSPLDEDETTEMLLTDAGTLPNTSTCYIYAESFKLLPHSLGRTAAGLDRAHIMLPNTEAIVTPSEQELLQMPLNTTTRFLEVDNAIEEAARNKERAKLSSTLSLENLSQAELTSSSTGYWITGLSIVTLILIFCCYYHRGTILRMCGDYWIRMSNGPGPQPRPRPRRNIEAQLSEESVCTVNTVLPLHVVESALGGEEQEEAETDLTAVSRAPTPFVSRGRVPVA